MRFATAVAVTVEIECPHCGAPLPNPDDEGSPWTAENIRAHEGPKACNACDKPFVLVFPRHVLMPLDAKTLVRNSALKRLVDPQEPT
jgi:hypothetical protein